MRIAQIAPLYESVPPKLYGGTERVVSWLTESLVRAGHDVTLFASGDSETSARLVPACARALWREPRCLDAAPSHLRLMEKVFRQADRFDILHMLSDAQTLDSGRPVDASTPADLGVTPDAGPAGVGERCSSDDDCESGVCFDLSSVDDGCDAWLCTALCIVSSNCPAVAAEPDCETAPDGTRFCAYGAWEMYCR